MYHSRHELCFDLSEIECVLISDQDCIIEDVVHPQYCYGPMAFADSLIGFFNRKYSLESD